jgi:class 3 adenylate cyclase/predicted ATPase
VDELERWLAPLGLAQLAPVLRANDVDLEILPELSEADLEKLGLSLGQRKRLLKAAASLPGPSSSAGLSATLAPRLSAPSSAERRQLTVMFCDLVGSTALSTRLDPEDLREVIGAYRRRVAKVVARYDGFIAQYMGDGVLIYFGYPQAHEDDAERAVRAGLKLAETIHWVRPRADVEPLQVRLGIATGLVVVGDLIGPGEAQEHDVVGETPNLAARLQALAEPNAVVVAASTRRLIGGLFEYEDLGAVEVKGFAEPVHAWRVRGRSAAESRFEAQWTAGVTPLIGREQEIALLLSCWESAKQGEGRVVLISGEPGIGKSRLALALRDLVKDEAHHTLRYFCSPHHTNSALHPIISQLEQSLQVEREEAQTDKLAKLEALLTPPAARIEHAVALLADLLSLPADGKPPLPETAPEKRRQQVFSILLAQLEGLAALKPVLMIVEDVHWLDPTSRELLALIIERAPSLPLLVIVIFRPEFAPPWTGEAHVTTLLLTRLAARQRTMLVRHVAGENVLPGRIVDEIAERTDGIPLFVEELTKAVLETGADGRDADWVVSAAPTGGHVVPATLNASLTARLDRVGPAREIAQVGAAIGREFSYELIAAVGRHNEDELRSGLERLTEAGLLFCRGSPPRATYQFKHALVQDAAYGMLLKSRRQQLHADIAGALEARSPASVQAQPEVVAYHYTKAGLGIQAIDFWLKAGQLANDRSANTEAVSHLTNGLALLSTLASGRHRDELELKLQSALAPALIATRGYGAPETVAAYERARTLMRATNEFSAQAGVLAGLYAVYVTRAEYEQALDVAEGCLRSAERRNEAIDLCVAHRLLAVSHDIAGNFPAARHHGEQAWASYDAAHHGPLAWRFAQDIGVAAGSFLSIALAHVGCFEQSARLTRDVLDLAERLGHRNTIGYAHCCAAALPAFFTRNFPMLRHHASKMQSFGREHQLPQWVSWGACLEAPALAAAGEIKQALDQMEAGLRLRERISNRYATRLILTGGAEVHLRAGDPRKALDLIGKLLDTAEATYERWTNAELWRLKADTLLAVEGGSAVSGAEACCRQAMSIAEGQGSRMLHLRAATGLARLMAERAERDRARTLLEPIVLSFSEGFQMPDLSEAGSLLDALR